MFANKHIVAALLIAPLLAVVAWFAVDMWVGERAQSPRQGDAYRLIMSSGCRYAGGRCILKNGNLEIELRATDPTLLEAMSSHELENVLVAWATDSQPFSEPSMMRSVDGPRRWRIRLPDATSLIGIRLLATSRGVSYFAEEADALELTAAVR
ncbi:MAG: hypothetical protein AAGJ86_08115 [Pseudomonadota bacterium]